ncbi:hypothetical protein C8R42DRAFT_724779 [Lentinula raphanica]|nr:hypothetical protein C8R42DRAFT_724779 [Lentinula raphanica]
MEEIGMEIPESQKKKVLRIRKPNPPSAGSTRRLRSTAKSVSQELGSSSYPDSTVTPASSSQLSEIPPDMAWPRCSKNAFGWTWFGWKKDGSVAELRDMTYEETVLRMLTLWPRNSFSLPTTPVTSWPSPKGVVGNQFLSFPFLMPREVWFKKDSLWAAADVEAVFDQDLERICILHRSVAVKGSIIKDEPIKDLLGNINSSLIQKVLQRNYGGDITTIPSINYLAPAPRPTRIPAGVKVTTTDTEIVYQLGKFLPTNPAWLSCIGSSYISNPIRRLFYPRRHEKVVVILSMDNQPLSLLMASAAKYLFLSLCSLNTNLRWDPPLYTRLLLAATRVSKPSTAASLASRNTSLKGRKCFIADLDDLKTACDQGFGAHGLVLQSVRAGDDEGTFETMIKTSSGEHVLNLNIMLSDTADYPKSQNCFSYSSDSNVAENIQSVIERIMSLPSRPIAETMDRVLANLTKAMSTGSIESEPEDESAPEDEDEGDTEEDYIDDDFYTSSQSQKQIQMSRLHRHFLEMVARDYHPGLIRFGGDEFCISVSLSVIQLAETVPPRALNAWDRRLLSKTQHLRGVQAEQGASEEACRNFGLIGHDAEDMLRLTKEKAAAEAALMYDDVDEFEPEVQEKEEKEEEEVPDRFDKFSLSGSLDSLMNHQFVKLVDMRRKYGLGWAGAELLYSEVERNQKSEEDVLACTLGRIQIEDEAEREMIRNGTTILQVPDDPIHKMGNNDQINWPLTAFCYLIRRLTLCTRYCIVCHNKLETDYVALKPYVCNSKLCSYQYYSLNHGPSLEYEIIHNPETVDLLVSITHSAAAENVLDEPLPIGMGLRVPLPDPTKVRAAPPNTTILNQIEAAAPTNSPPPQAQNQPVIGSDGLCDFDELEPQQMRASVMELLDSLPPIMDMKKHLEQNIKPGKSKPKLHETPVAENIVPTAWKLLRWCVRSCTAYLEEISSEEEKIVNVDNSWKQYRFSVGAPDAEAKFKAAIEESKAKDKNAWKYPSLYAFHGSPLRNWHSLNAEDIEKFCGIVNNADELFNSVRNDKVSAPMDFAIVAGWQAIIKSIFPASIDGDLFKLVHLSNSFRMIKVVRALQAGDVCTSQAKIVSVVNSGPGKIVKVKGHVYRDGKPVIKVVSAFLYRGVFTDHKNTFETTEEPDYIVTLSSDAEVGVLQSKEWFDWEDENKPLPLISPIAPLSENSQFQADDAHGNPVVSYLQRHGVP